MLTSVTLTDVDFGLFKRVAARHADANSSVPELAAVASTACSDGVAARAEVKTTDSYSEAQSQTPRGWIEPPGVQSLPLYPEGRACTRPMTQKLIELFEPIQRHAVLRQADSATDEDQEPLILITTPTPVQRKIVQLLGLKPAAYGN